MGMQSERELSEKIAAKLVDMGCNISCDEREEAMDLPSDDATSSLDEQTEAPADHGTPDSAR